MFTNDGAYLVAFVLELALSELLDSSLRANLAFQ